MEIEDATGPDLKSKLNSLIHSFRASPFKAAPEREAEMRNIRDELGVCIRMDVHETDWIFEGRSYFGANQIVVSLRSLERLWCVCYAFTAIVSEIQKVDGDYFRLQHSKEYALAFRTLDWVKQDTLADLECSWPDWMPSPRDKDSLEHVEAADHYFLMTSGRILLHEIAHFKLKHSTNPDADPEALKQEEIEADDWADDWLFEQHTDYNDDARVFVGRAMGVAFCHAITLFFGSRKKEISKTHPNPIDRLVNFVDRKIPLGKPIEKRIEHAPCGMLLVVIGKLLFDKGDSPNFEDLDESYAEIFKRFRDSFK